MAGIYIHIPFCKQACTYCDFHFSTTFEAYRMEMIDCIIQEIVSRKSSLLDQEITTIYFGGGTPSLLLENELNAIITTIFNHYNVCENPEITLEANPDDINMKALQIWKNNNINRLSIGVQSFDNEDLTWMNRAHRSEEAIQAIQLAKKMNFLLTVDLIYGLPNSNLEKLEKNLAKLIELAPEHISCYCLTVEEKTVLHHQQKNNLVQLPEEEHQAEQFLMVVACLEKAGYLQYEISNFAKDGHFAQHNSNYWKMIPYLGFGPSAHSFIPPRRRWNVAANRKYIQLLSKNEKYFEEELLSEKELLNEAIMTGLRTIWGFDLANWQTKTQIPKDFYTQINTFQSAGWIKEENGKIILTKQGKLRADYIASELFQL
jgi:oxygen-independent coproporphyrinogen-3 oxidase